MATLQKLRNAGPLLLIFVGLALLAFIAGDALRIFQTPQGSQSVGEVNGEEISAVEFQDLYERQSNIYKMLRGGSNFTETEQNQIKDEVWGNYLRGKIINKEAEKLGLTVTVAELKEAVQRGEDPIFQQIPIFNNEQGKFDFDNLNMFLAQYEENKNDAAFIQQYQPLYDTWRYMEETLMQNLLSQKYYALVSNSFISNPVVAENNYNTNSYTYDVEYRVYPYSAISDSTIKVSDSDLNKIYEQEKVLYPRYSESRDIKYVSFRVTPSAADRAALNNELKEYATQLQNGDTDYTSMSRLSMSDVPYSELAWAKDIYPEEVQVRLDSVAENQIVGPFYNQSDDSYTLFKYFGKKEIADSVLYRSLFVQAETPEKTAALADSLLGALNGGANFKEIAAKYGQENSDSMWLTSAMYEGGSVIGDNLSLVNTLLNAKKGEYTILSLENQNTKLICSVLDKKNNETKYNAFVIKRKSEFSSTTYEEAYNQFSQFVASCNTIEDFEKNAEEHNYRVQVRNDINSSAHNIANVPGTQNALRWLFQAEKGNVSPLYECGNNDNLLVVALADINEKGYISKEKLGFITDKALNAKKAEKIMSIIKGKSYDELANVEGVKSDKASRISFVAPVYVTATSASEPALCAAVTKLQPGETSAPIKGEAGIYVIKLVAKNKKAGEFNAATEQATLKSQAQRASGRFLNDLFEKANVVDNRYLYF